MACVVAAGEGPAAASSAPTAIESLEIGAISPDFKSTDIDGKAVSLATWPDHSIVFYFGSAGSAAGQRGLRRLDRLARSMANEPAGFVAILPEGSDELASAKALRSEWGLEVRMIQDAGGAIAREFGVRRRPTVVVVDKSRTVRAVHDRFGVMSAGDVKTSIKEAISRAFPAGEVGNAVADPDADLPAITDYIRKPTRQFKMVEYQAARLQRIDREARQLHVFSMGAPTAWDFDHDGRLDFCFLQQNGVMVLPGTGVGTLVVRLGSNRDGGSVCAACPVEEAGGVGWFSILQGWDGSQSSWAFALFDKEGRVRWSSAARLPSSAALYPRGVVSSDLDGDGLSEYVAGVDLYRTEKKAGMIVGSTQQSYLVVLSATGEVICIASVGDDKANIGWMTATSALGADRPGRIFVAISGTLQAFELERGAARAGNAAPGAAGVGAGRRTTGD